MRRVEMIVVVQKQPLAIIEQPRQTVFFGRSALAALDVGPHAFDQVAMQVPHQQRGRALLLEPRATGDRRVERRDGVADPEMFEHQPKAKLGRHALMQSDLDDLLDVVFVRGELLKPAATSGLSPSGRK